MVEIGGADGDDVVSIDHAQQDHRDASIDDSSSTVAVTTGIKGSKVFFF